MGLPSFIGITGADRPSVCAASGQLLKGKPSISYSLPDGYYYRVLARHQEAWNDALESNHASVIGALNTALNPPETKPFVKAKKEA